MCVFLLEPRVARLYNTPTARVWRGQGSWYCARRLHCLSMWLAVHVWGQCLVSVVAKFACDQRFIFPTPPWAAQTFVVIDLTLLLLVCFASRGSACRTQAALQSTLTLRKAAALTSTRQLSAQADEIFAAKDTVSKNLNNCPLSA